MGFTKKGDKKWHMGQLLKFTSEWVDKITAEEYIKFHMQCNASAIILLMHMLECSCLL